MSKYSILLVISILGGASAQAWDGKLIKFNHPHKGCAIGLMARYYDAKHVAVAIEANDDDPEDDDPETDYEVLIDGKTVEATLVAEGFKHSGDGWWIPSAWSKVIDGLKYYTDGQALCEDESDLGDVSEQELYQSLKDFINSDDMDIWIALSGNIQIMLTCKEHSSLAKVYLERYLGALKRLQQDYPNLTYQVIDYVDGKPVAASPSYQSPWSRFVNFLSKEKIALGLTSLGAVMLAASHYYSR